MQSFMSLQVYNGLHSLEVLDSMQSAPLVGICFTCPVSYHLKFFNRVFLTAGTNEPLDANSPFFLFCKIERNLVMQILELLPFHD